MLEHRGPAGAGGLAGFLCAAGILLTPCLNPVQAQTDIPSHPPGSPLPDQPYSHFHALLEKTFLKVDVLTLDIHVDAMTARRVGEMVRDRSYSDDLASSVARTVLSASEAFVRMEFVRTVKQGQFLNGIKDNLDRARAAGFITQEHRDQVVAKLPEWYAFLAERKAQKGDVVVYRIRGNTMQTTYYGVEGTVHLDLTRVGEKHRYGVLGSYFAPKSAFRKRLVRSILD